MYEEASKAHLDFGILDMDSPCDRRTAYELAVLLRTLTPMYREKVAPTMTSMYIDDEPRIEYQHLWILCRPGSCVYVQESAFSNSLHNQRRRGIFTDRTTGNNMPDDDERTAWIVSSWRYAVKTPPSLQNQRPPNVDSTLDRFLLELWSVRWDGICFQRVGRQAIITEFDAFRSLRDLEIIPAVAHDRLDTGVLRERLKIRGRRYLSIIGEPVAHREYNHQPSGYHGQIIIDEEGHMQFKHRVYELHNRFPITHPPPIADGTSGRFQDLLDFQPGAYQDLKRVDELSILLPRRVFGLGLKTKRWMAFEIDNISDHPPRSTPKQLDNELVLISDDDRASLGTVLPKGQQPVSVSTDFVAGKGEGKVFLLYGPPGTGKTLTVECVANDTRRPLISLTIADISEEDSNVEARLREWFTIADKWDAILLIDEADIFLEQRRDGDSGTNTMATVFLRSLEYYKGVLFLTTNRPGHIDDSFISRITCPIAYRPLTPETKSKIIHKFVRRYEKTGTIEVDKSATNYLVGNCKELNGRQIRNVLQNAAAAAEMQQRAERESAALDGQPQRDCPVLIKKHHIKTSVERQIEFLEYLKSLKGGKDESTRALARRDYLSST